MDMHPQARGLLAAMEEEGAPPLYELTLEDARAAPGVIAELIGPGPDVASVEDIEVPVASGSVAARVYEPVPEVPGTVVYYHGGGWVIGSIDQWDAVTRALAVQSGCRVVSVEYRLAPEHRFPAAVDDAFDAFVWIAGNLAKDAPLVVAGDSAGGNLAAVVALRTRDAGGPQIALQVLVYPVVDHDFGRPSYAEHGGGGLILNTAEMEWFWDNYAPDVATRAHPDASPLRARDHAGLPPAYVLVAEFDPLRDEGLAYAAKLEAAKVPVTLRRFDDQIHAFFGMVNLMESADLAVAEAGEAIRSACEAARSTPLDAAPAGS
jgi:acetyl esterase/lipase